MSHKTNRSLILVAILLAISTLACSVLGSGGDPTATPDAQATLQSLAQQMTALAPQIGVTSAPTSMAQSWESTQNAPQPEGTAENSPGAAVSPNEPFLRLQELGPWAPGSDGSANNFEVTCNETVCVAALVDLWWPGGQTPWGTAEIQTLVPAGLSIEALAAAGRGWEYPVGYSTDVLLDELIDHMARRERDTNHFGFVSVDTLLELGLVDLRFDWRVGSKDSTWGLTPAYP